MKVTLITATYNRRSTVEDAIRSVLGQDYPDIEYLIMDGASTDGTVEFVQELLDHEAREGVTPLIRRHAKAARLVSEPDKGMYEALNKGMRRAQGDVIGLVHSDDRLMSADVVSRYVRCFERIGADLVYADGQFVDEHDPQKLMRLWVSGSFRRWKVSLGWLPLHPTVYIRRAALNYDVLYDQQYRVAADTKFLIYYLHEAPLRVGYLPQYVISMRMGGLSTNPQHSRKIWDEDVSIYQTYGFKTPRLLKMMKMAWKVPQFVNALLRRMHFPFNI